MTRLERIYMRIGKADERAWKVAWETANKLDHYKAEFFCAGWWRLLAKEKKNLSSTP